MKVGNFLVWRAFVLVGIMQAEIIFARAVDFGPCSSPVTLSSVVEDSYDNHVSYVRRGLPSELVKSFYDSVLLNITEPECMCKTSFTVNRACVDRVFTPGVAGLISSKLEAVVMKDSARSLASRMFPRLEPVENLPPLLELELRAVAKGRADTLSNLSTISAPTWLGAMFPSNEVLRFDKTQARACDEFAQKMDGNSLWLPATALTAYVMGVAHQILLLRGNTAPASMMLQEHVRMVYTAARCRRVTGEKLRVPAVFLEGFITRAHLALKNSSIGPSSAFVIGFPDIAAVHEIVRGSRTFFPLAVQRMSSLDSFGRTSLLQWDGDTVVAERLEDVMVRNASLRVYNDFYGRPRAERVGQGGACAAGFNKTERLRTVTRDGEECCSNSCLRTGGSKIKVAVMNEMCCEVCWQGRCNVEDLATVIQAQGFGFERERESAVANVW